MILLVLISSIVAVSQGQICCVPPQWEGIQGTVIAVSMNDTADPTMVTGLVTVAYDATNQRVGAHMYMQTGGYNTDVGVILNFAQGVQYTVSGNNCTRSPLPAFTPTCIPSDAKLTKTGYMGPPNNKLSVNSYTYKRGGLEVSASVTADSCVPVGEVVSGMTGNEFVMQSVGFSNITAGISQATNTALNPPASCMNSPMVPVNLNSMASRLLRRFLTSY